MDKVRKIGRRQGNANRNVVAISNSDKARAKDAWRDRQKLEASQIERVRSVRDFHQLIASRYSASTLLVVTWCIKTMARLPGQIDCVVESQVT